MDQRRGWMLAGALDVIIAHLESLRTPLPPEHFAVLREIQAGLADEAPAQKS